jgi:DNA-directed RNA polymerase specialized sigma24 family protein
MLSCNDSQKADDLMQELFVHLQRVRLLWDPNKGAWYPWARRNLTGVASGVRRSAKSEAVRLDGYYQTLALGETNCSVLSEQERIDVREAVRFCLNELRDTMADHVDAMLLWRLDNRTMGEIAESLGVPQAKARKMIADVELELRQLLIEQGFSHRGCDGS